jgi:hypothetical protein
MSLAKGLFSFGCLVTYSIVIKDNFANGLEGAIYGSTTTIGYSTSIIPNDNNTDDLI